MPYLSALDSHPFSPLTRHPGRILVPRLYCLPNRSQSKGSRWADKHVRMPVEMVFFGWSFLRV